MSQKIIISENEMACTRAYSELRAVCDSITMVYDRLASITRWLRQSPSFCGSRALASFSSSLATKEAVIRDIRCNLAIWEEFYMKWQKALKDMYAPWEKK